MLVNQSFDEIRAYAGVAERTGVLFQRNDVRRSSGCCGSLTELIRKARPRGWQRARSVWNSRNDGSSCPDRLTLRLIGTIAAF